MSNLASRWVWSDHLRSRYLVGNALVNVSSYQSLLLSVNKSDHNCWQHCTRGITSRTDENDHRYFFIVMNSEISLQRLCRTARLTMQFTSVRSISLVQSGNNEEQRNRESGHISAKIFHQIFDENCQRWPQSVHAGHRASSLPNNWFASARVFVTLTGSHPRRVSMLRNTSLRMLNVTILFHSSGSSVTFLCAVSVAKIRGPKHVSIHHGSSGSPLKCPVCHDLWTYHKRVFHSCVVSRFGINVFEINLFSSICILTLSFVTFRVNIIFSTWRVFRLHCSVVVLRHNVVAGRLRSVYLEFFVSRITFGIPVLAVLSEFLHALDWHLTESDCPRCAFSALGCLEICRKERTYPELVGDSQRVKLIVLVGEIDGRFSEETHTFVRLLVRTKTRSISEPLRTRARQSWMFRWGSLLNCVAVRTFASSLLDRPGHSGADDIIPSDAEVLADFSRTPPVVGKLGFLSTP